MIERIINGVNLKVDPHSRANIYFPNSFVQKLEDYALDQILDLFYLEKKQYTPLALTWEVTNVCNFSCPFCYINTSDKITKTTDFNKILADLNYLIDNGLLICYLTGGEILTYPYFNEIYLYLKQKGVLVALLTNLSLLNEEHIALFKKYPPYKITVSIYGISDSIFQSVTGTKLSYNHILENILKLKKNGINVTCQTPINTYTLDEYVDIGKWCEENQIKYTCSNELNPTYQGATLDKYYIPNDIFENYKQKITRVQTIHSNSLPHISDIIGYKKHFDCRAGKHTFALSHDYYLRPCFVLYGKDCKRFWAGNSMRKALEDMIEYINEMNERTIKFCRGCVAVNICNECIFTQTKHQNLKEYMDEQCSKNMQLYQSIKKTNSPQ